MFIIQMKKLYRMKKIFAIIFILVMGLTALSRFLPTALGSGEIDGHDWSYQSGNQPDFCECNHSTFYNQADDTEVGVGLQEENEAYGYDWGYWHFEAECGGYLGYLYTIESPLECVSFVTGPYSGDLWCYYNCYDEPQYGVINGNSYPCLYVTVDSSGSYDVYYTTVACIVTSYFHELGNPSNSYYMQAYSQAPSYDPENGWGYLTFNWADD